MAIFNTRSDVSKRELYSNDVNKYLTLLSKFRKKHPLKLKRKIALVVLDVEKAFFDLESKTYLPISQLIFPKIKKLCETFDKYSLPVILTTHYDTKKYMKNWWKHAIPKEMSEFSIDKMKRKIIIKHHYDAFLDTKLETLLYQTKMEQIVLAGVMTHLCVDTTARSAFMRGFSPVLAIDAIGSKNEVLHLSSLLSLSHGVAYISTTEEIESCIEKSR